MSLDRIRLLLVAGGLALAPATASAVDVVAPTGLPAPADLALADLERAFADRGTPVARRPALPETGPPAVVVGLAGTEPVDRLLAAAKVVVPAAPESLAVRRLTAGGRAVLVIAGRDPRGLAYALLDAARAVRLAPPGGDGLAAVAGAAEAPFLRTRSLTVHLFNAELEAGWYFDDGYWRDYFAALAAHRFNGFTLTFADQTNYLCPVYAHLLDVPGFPEVRVRGVTAAARRRNLAALKSISEAARARGLDFTLGVWMQLPVPAYPPKVEVENLPGPDRAAAYCAAGLGAVLKACPAINGVQLRMNAEAGVPEDQQTAFYTPLFAAIRDCGRPVRLDLRYKGLQPATTKAAADARLDVTVSTKFWGEHFGLPYHPTAEDPLYRESRYGFGRMLEYPRPYRVVYRLWTCGSQRLTAWGDPEYAARFARSCRVGGGEGFEVFAPLTNRGYGNGPGPAEVFADRSLAGPGRAFDRHWFFTLSFGRLGFNPDCDPEVWRRELRHRFGDAAADVEAAYRAASRVLPLVTAARLPSASEWSWWPEMDTGDRLAEYARTPPGDPAQFYAVRTWARTPRWRAEAWTPNVPGYVEDAVAGRVGGRTTPFEVANELEGIADAATRAIDRANAATRMPPAEFRATALDVRLLALLARYHAEKTRAATHHAFFEATGEAGRLKPALVHMRAADDAWASLVRLTDGAYADGLVMGTTPQTARNKFGHHHSGHWKDRRAEVREDVAYLEELARKHAGAKPEYRTFPGETATEAPRVAHDPARVAVPGEPLAVAVTVTGGPAVKAVVLHHRRLDQTADWQAVPMAAGAAGRWAAAVPGADISARWDVQYYVEVLYADGGGRLWPPWRDGQPYVVVPVRRTP